ncbi:hypothetical protein A5N15_06175 [Rothia kristinae]|uniref:Uncharacterized protein n=2 Tax=Rothia kristinae TaxID=37923 RepID=A0A657IUG8_9MICC|nr:hypothetical protein SA11R_07795 [Rothia kristinae]OAX60323.1 hypothetical protein A5N15_06175 [Rothia kristinae]
MVSMNGRAWASAISVPLVPSMRSRRLLRVVSRMPLCPVKVTAPGRATSPEVPFQVPVPSLQW